MTIDLCILSGTVDGYYIGVETKLGVKRLARPLFGFPNAGRPSSAWVTKYKDKFFAAIAYDANNAERALFIGLIPMEGVTFPEEGIDDNIFMLSEKFRLWFNDGENKTIWEALAGGQLLLGDKDVTEPAVLGNKLKSLLSDVIDQTKAAADASALIIVNTVVGPSSVPTNAATFTSISTQLTTIKSQLDTILSEIIKLK